MMLMKFFDRNLKNYSFDNVNRPTYYNVQIITPECHNPMTLKPLGMDNNTTQRFTSGGKIGAH